MGLYASRWPETTILDNKDGKFVAPPPPAPNQGWKMARFGFYSSSSLIWGGGVEVCCSMILSKIVVLTEFNYPNQRNVYKNWRNKNIQRKNKTEIELKYKN